MQIRKTYFCLSALTLASAAMVVACGGGGSATASNGSATPNASSLYAGPIQGFGSVIVNGMRFASVGSTLVDDDGNNVNLRDLKLGMTVLISGAADDSTGLGSATQVELVHGTRGTITAIDLTARTITLLGQTIKTDTNTAFQGVANLAALTVGQTVEISGAQQADGSVLATLVEVKAITAISLSGVVANLNTDSNSFKIGTLTVNYPANAVIGTLANGA